MSMGYMFCTLLTSLQEYVQLGNLVIYYIEDVLLHKHLVYNFYSVSMFEGKKIHLNNHVGQKINNEATCILINMIGKPNSALQFHVKQCSFSCYCMIRDLQATFVFCKTQLAYLFFQPLFALSSFQPGWFIVQASFLSLNLHALAEQLAKIDLSQRLFIEADLLPPELVCFNSHCDVENYLVTLCSKFIMNL